MMAKRSFTLGLKLIVKTPRLTDAQFVTLLWMKNHGKSRIVHWPGGFWTIPGMTHEKGKADIPRWSCSTGTVMAMGRKGLIINVEPGAPTWCARRKITPLGNDALFRAEAIDPMRRRKICDNPDLWMLAESVKLEAVYKSKLPIKKRKIR